MSNLRRNDFRSREPIQNSSVHLEDVARSLRIFAQALCGRRFVLKPWSELTESYRVSFWRTRHIDGDTIFLPKVFDHFPTSFMNYLAFKLAAAHQAGYVEFGTFTFKLSSIHDLFPPDLFLSGLRSICKEAIPASPLEVFFRLFPNREMARDIFHILEGARIDHLLRKEYPGMKKEMDEFLQGVLADRRPAASLPLKEAMIEFILRATVGGQEGGNIPQTFFSCLEDLPSVINPLLEKGATVEDSARATVTLYGLISSLTSLLPGAFPPETRLGQYHVLSGIPGDSGDWGLGLQSAERGGAQYQSMVPLPHRGQWGPELLQHRLHPRDIRPLLNDKDKRASLSTEALRELLEKGIEIDLQILGGAQQNGLPNLSLMDLKDVKGLSGRLQETRERPEQDVISQSQSFTPEGRADVEQGVFFYYDEWDYRISDYRLRWCRLNEKPMIQGLSDFVAKTLESHAGLVAEVRRQFQMLRPEYFKKIPQLERGDEIDLNAAIEASVDRRAGLTPSEKIYIARERKDRDFSTLFLLDMSASTNDRIDGKAAIRPVSPPAIDKIIFNPRFYDPDYVSSCATSEPEGKRVIDIEKESLVIMAEALKEIGDEYAIYGFSSYGRRDVEFYAIKNFDDEYDEDVKRRIDAIEPQRSTRMGTAVRHALSKISGRRAKTKNIILISDGYPQDHDYGEGRLVVEYGLQDTKAAFQEAARRNTHLFCITVDLAGNDYLRKMCPDSQYLVIEETAELPRVLPKIYRRLTT